MKKTLLAFAALVAVSAPAAAQSFTALGVPDNLGGQFWDHYSDDYNGVNTSCNAGFILTGNASLPECRNQRPDWLPYTGAYATDYYNNAGNFASFYFGAGSYNFSLLPGTGLDGGDIAGADQEWGYFDVVGLTTHSLNGAGAIPASNVAIGGYWGLYIRTTDNTIRYSTLDPQFALFFASTSPNQLMVGMEDIYVPGGGSDADYNDVMFRISAAGEITTLSVVPEPATMTLLATGLAGMAAASRRRKTKK